jgi:hypothetical protein
MTRAVELAQVAAAGVSEAFKNRIINGAMVIAQRTTSSQTISTTAVFPVDRFGVNSNITTGSTTIQSSTVPTGQGFVNSSLVTIGTGATPVSNDYFRFRQLIEGYNVADLGWGTASAKTITVSFWVRSSLTGNFGFGFQSTDSGYGTSYTINSANTWEYKTITITGATGGTWATDNSNGLTVLWDLGEGPSRCAATSNTWSYSATACGLSGGVKLAATSGATWYITGVQLEVGSSATGFEYVNYQTSLANCQRYWQKSYTFGTVAGTATQVGAADLLPGASMTGVMGCLVNFRVEMRGIPTVTLYDLSGASGKVYKGADGKTGVLQNQATTGFTGYTSDTTSAAEMLFQWTATAEL